MKTLTVMTLILSIGLSACVSQEEKNMASLQVIEHVDLPKYMGEWYEIARYPNSFQKNCERSKATYSLRDDGKVKVLNECYDLDFSTLIRSAKGKAWVVNEQNNAKLKVSFFWPFSGDYWIIELGREYEYAVVGHPKRKYLWILNRLPHMEEKLYERILTKLEKHEYDTSKLISYKKGD